MPTNIIRRIAESMTMNKNLKIRIGFILFTGILMFIIFLFSSQNSGASHHLSRGVLDTFVQAFNIELTQKQLNFGNWMLRKIAHFSLYFSLAVGLMGIFSTTNLHLQWGILFTLLVCLCFASGDEIYQLLLGTRNGNIKDVLLDFIGTTCGVIVCRCVCKEK